MVFQKILKQYVKTGTLLVEFTFMRDISNYRPIYLYFDK